MKSARPAIFSRRRAGVLLHITSLPGGHGIGDLGPQAHSFADWCARSGQGIWQVLPIGPVGPGNSPYASTSSFAGEPLMVSLDRLADDRLLPRASLAVPRALERAFAGDRVHWPSVRAFKTERLVAAYEAWRGKRGHTSAAYRAFQRRSIGWLPGWCRFASAERGAPRHPGYHAFVQWVFDQQWQALHAHCTQRGVLLLGDLPIFVSLRSADVQDHPGLFRLDRKGQPTVVTGVPPDCFSRDGQRWGHPHYRWSEHRRTRFAWWIARVRHALSRCDALRVDHFVGLVHAFEIPARDRTARRGSWKPTPGRELLTALERACGRLPLVAEDLGAVTPAVVALRERFGLPGMKLVHNAFYGPDSGDLPSLHPVDSVVYSGTHDNDTTVGWHAGLPAPARARFAAYAGLGARATHGEVCQAMARIVLASPARTAVLPLQDWLHLGHSARMNLPGKATGQWCFRATTSHLAALDPATIRGLAEATARV